MTNAPALTVTVHDRISNEDLLKIQQLRYQVYAEELKLPLACIDHRRKLLADPLDSSAIHISAKAAEMVPGAIRLNIDRVPAGLEVPLETLHLPRPFVYCSRFVVLPAWRGSEVMNRLSRAGFDEVARCGAAVAICHCYRPVEKLYRRMGFRPYGTPFAIPGLEYLGLQTPMRWAALERRVSEAA